MTPIARFALAASAVFAAVAMVVSCGDSESDATQVLYHDLVGKTDDEGNLVIHVFHSADRPPVPLPVVLEDDYAFMIFNSGTVEKPAFLVRITSRNDRTIKEATDWIQVREILGTFPKGSRFLHYGKCLAPTYYGLPDKPLHKFIGLLEELGHNYDESLRITCNCFQNGG